MTFEGLSAACSKEYGNRVKYDPALLKQPFGLPVGCSAYHSAAGDPGFKSSLIRVMCQCKVAHPNYQYPSWIQGHFIVFNEDVFGVMFLRLGTMSLFCRVPNKEIAARSCYDLDNLRKTLGSWKKMTRRGNK